MQHAPKETLPSLPPGGRTAGVDWARDDHAVAIVDAGGGIQERFTVPHSGAGIRALVGHCPRPEPTRSRSNDLTVRSSTRSSRQVSLWSSSAPTS